MKKFNQLRYIKFILFTCLLAYIGCSKDEITYDQTRLFRPALNGSLKAVQNTIILNLAQIKEAKGYIIEISRDSFKTMDYKIQIDTNSIILNEEVLGGDPLLYNTNYQLRSTAIAASAEFNSKAADLGSVRTERFPSIQLLPRAYDVTDTRAKVRWTSGGAEVTKVRIFAKEDLKLKTSLAEYDVTANANSSGESIIDKLTPNTSYQVAIYSGTTLRGWVDYKTLVKGVDKTNPLVVNLSESEDPNAVISAIASAPNNAIILVKRGVRYNLPTALLTNSVTFRADYGFSPNKATLFTTSNMNVAVGAKISLIKFEDVEVLGEDVAGDYVFNISNAGAATTIDSLIFENCIINNFRGIARLRSDSFIGNFIINNSIVFKLGDYGIFTLDTDGAGKATIENVRFTKSTFYQLVTFITSRQNVGSWLVDQCTLNQFTATNQQTFRFRGSAGFNNITKGLTITNSIFGSGWDNTTSGNSTISFNKDGLKETPLTIINTWSTSDLSILAGSEMTGFPGSPYSGTSSKLWPGLSSGDFRMNDPSFGGRTTAGDPRWR